MKKWSPAETLPGEVYLSPKRPRRTPLLAGRFCFLWMLRGYGAARRFIRTSSRMPFFRGRKRESARSRTVWRKDSAGKARDI